jgi:hypothetical protein
VTLEQQDQAVVQSVRYQPEPNEGDYGVQLDALVLGLATAADEFEPWGRDPVKRDRQLRNFWPTEPILASAVYSLAIRNAAFSWTLDGPERTVEAIQDMLAMADLGAGWQSFSSKLSVDVMTQDNGGFIEVIRERDEVDAPVIGIAHLDAGRCVRTGNAETPVIYQDVLGRFHRLKRHQVVAVAELPSPVETMRGMQLCAVSRVLRAAQYLRDIGVYQREKVSGNNPNQIHIVSGVGSKQISDAMQTHKDTQAAKGMMRFIIPLIIGSIDPSATVSKETIDLKSLPDSFNLDDSMRWYINQLALGFGVDYQEFAPLPGRGIGSSTEALVLHLKSRGKGPGFWMKLLEYTFNFHGLIPQNVTFSYDEQDVEADLEEAELGKIVADTLEALIRSATLDPQAGRQILLDDGYIDEETFDRLSETGDLTSNVTAQDVEPVENKAVSPVALVKASHLMRRRRRRKKPNGKKAPRVRYAQVADFAEAERVALEEEIAAAMDDVLARAMRRARTIMGLEGVEAAKRGRFTALRLGHKQTPDDIIGDEVFWRDFREDAIVTMTPFARRGALEAIDANIAVGVGVDLELVNQQVLTFTGTYTNEWWAALEGTSRAQLRDAVASWQQGGLGSRGFPDLVKAIEPTFGRVRARRIAITEATKIFDGGNLMAHEAGGINEEEWQTARDARVDDICRPLDGQRFPINAGPRPVTGTHIGCVLPGTRVCATGVERAYRAWYEGSVLELALHGGQRLTVTPNHPILTPDGWVAAEFLRPGSDVISGSFGEGEVALGGKDVADRPPLIEEIFASLSVVRRVGVTTTEFHGDGRGMHGDIDVVGSDGELRCACGASSLQPLHEGHLIGRAVPQAVLVGGRVLGLFARRGFAAPHRVISRCGEVLTALWGQLAHTLQVGLRPTAWDNASLAQALAHQGARHIEGKTQREFGLTGPVPGHERGSVHLLAGAAHNDVGLPEDAVELGLGDGESLAQVLDRCAFPVGLSQIIAVTRREYAGHVYDLQTNTSLYQAAGVIVHNCRCARLPVGPGGETLGR